MIETTVNMHMKTRYKLLQASNKTGLCFNRLIRLLLQYSLRDEDNTISSFGRIRYQDRRETKDWTRFHLTLDERDYELLLDVRKFYKVSVSLFLARAIDTILRTLINRILKKSLDLDNYPINCYTIIQATTDNGDVYWKLYWGIP